jgi:DNA polymerase-4
VFVRSDASILHADLDAFYASVEQRDDPQLRGRPVIVGGGVVLTASYEARACGVRTAMGGAQARRLCPAAVVVPPRMSAYTEASRAVFEVFGRTTPLVEALSIDEAFLDVGGLRRIAGTPTEIAVRLRADVLAEVGLRITVGIARTKFLAKVASGVAKPDGLLLVPPDGELSFLHPLAVERLWGVGPVTARKLHDRGIATVAEVAALTEGSLVAMLGRASGRHLHALAHNHDPRPVQVRRRRRSIGSQRALGRTIATPAGIDAVVVGLVDRITRRMRDAGRVGRTVTLRLRFADLTRVTRSHTLPRPTAATAVVLGDDQGAAGHGVAARRAARAEPRRCGRGEPRRRRSGPARPAVRGRGGRAARRRARRRPAPLRHGRGHPRRAARPRPRPGGPDAPRLTPSRRPRSGPGRPPAC